MSTYNSICPLCGSQAYQGFVSIECSSSGCKNYKAQATPEPKLSLAEIILTPPLMSSLPAPVPPPCPPAPPFPVGATGVTKITILPTPVSPPFYQYKMVENSVFDPVQIEALQVLDKIRLMDPNAKIMGGAARDWYLGRFSQLNDVDIYHTLDVSPGLMGLGLHKVQKKINLTKAQAQISSYPADIEVVDFNAPGSSVDYQLIKVKHIDDFLATFDFGLNMIQCWSEDGGKNVKYLVTTMFETDWNSSHLTFYPNHISKFGLRKLPERWIKMTKKFPFLLAIGKM